MKNKYRKYVFAIIFLKNAEGKFLVFHRKKNWKGWEFLKGGLIEKEDEVQTLKREIREETGNKKFRIIAKTRYFIKYKWKKNFRKDHHLFHGAEGRVFVVRLFGKKVKIDRTEHDSFRWLDSKQTLKYLTHVNLKHAFKYFLRNYNL